MSRIEHYRELYEYERDCNEKMLAMMESVPASSRSDARFQQAVSIAGHLVACRRNWLDHIKGVALPQAEWYDEKCDLAALRPQFAASDSRWADYLAHLGADELAQNFEFFEGSERFSLPVEVQVVQLFGHASYHRGQIALLVSQLGGKVEDTDYVDWWWVNRRAPGSEKEA